METSSNPLSDFLFILSVVQSSTHVDFMDGAAVRVPFCCRSPAAAAVLVLTCGGLSFVRRLLLLSADDVELSVVDAAVRLFGWLSRLLTSRVRSVPVRLAPRIEVWCGSSVAVFVVVVVVGRRV